MKTSSSRRFALSAAHPSRLILLRLASLALVVLTLLPHAAHAQGGVPLWTNRYNGPGNADDVATAIAVDSSGNVFVTGYSYDTDGTYAATIKYSGTGVPLWANRHTGGNSTYAIAVDGSDNVFVTGAGTTIKYSGAGVPLWTNAYPGHAYAIALDSSGNVFVTGESRASTNFNCYSDYATIVYSNSGVPLWTNRYDGPGNCLDDSGRAIAVDSSGKVFVTGHSNNSPFGDPSSYATIAYSNAGLPLWTNRFDYGDATAIAVDSSGNVFVTGEGLNGSIYTFTTIKISTEGELLWTRSYDGLPRGNRGDAPQGIAVDSSGNVFVTGQSWNGSHLDFATIKYSTEGEPLWTRRYNGPANADDGGYAIALDRSGNVFVTGSKGVSGTSSDYATFAYSNTGVPLWTNLYNGPGNGNDNALAIAVDRSGSVFVTGYSVGNGFRDYVTIKYSSSVPPPRLDSQLLSNQLVLSWTNAGFNLQSAAAVPGTFTNLPGATSRYTNPISGAQQFFRLKRN